MHIGSADSNFKTWNHIAENSILVSVDGNNSSVNTRNNFKKVIDQKVIISNKNGVGKFYLTHDPNCSSLLEPDKSTHENWYFSHRFKIKKIQKKKIYSLNNFLKSKKINYIDWFVTDVQGKDLEIIKSLKKNIRDKISIIDIEAGFLSFYKKQDKISEVFRYMSKSYNFENMEFGYNYRLSSKILNKLEKKILFRYNKPSKVYSNIIFTNKKKNIERINLIKLIYLVENNKIFEAKQLVKNISKKNLFYKEILKELEFIIKIHKFKFLILSPFLLIKKFLYIIFK